MSPALHPFSEVTEPNRFSPEFIQAAEALIRIGQVLAARGQVPATSGNFSVRIANDRLAITASGKDKGALSLADILLTDARGLVLGDGKPSAETGLHTQLYQLFPGVGAVLHTHSRNATVLSRRFAEQGGVTLAGYELLKAFGGIGTHATSLFVPIVANEQHIPTLAENIAPHLEHVAVRAYLIAGHGAYVWGKDLGEAARHLEALEFLLECELENLRLEGGACVECTCVSSFGTTQKARMPQKSD